MENKQAAQNTRCPIIIGGVILVVTPGIIAVQALPKQNDTTNRNLIKKASGLDTVEKINQFAQS